jgi:hypothetical protein
MSGFRVLRGKAHLMASFGLGHALLNLHGEHNQGMV